MLPVAKETGWVVYGLILVSVVTFVLSLPWLGAILALLALLSLFLFRDFRRIVPPLPLSCLCPVDGVVLAVNEGIDPFLERPTICYQIQQSFWGEFNLHCPVEGKTERLWGHAPGNEQSHMLAFWVKTDEEDSIVTAVDLGNSIRYARSSVQPGERIGHGQRCGFAGFGCKVNVYLPANAIKTAHVGDRVKAGSDILATLVHA